MPVQHGGIRDPSRPPRTPDTDRPEAPGAATGDLGRLIRPARGHMARGRGQPDPGALASAHQAGIRQPPSPGACPSGRLALTGGLTGGGLPIQRLPGGSSPGSIVMARAARAPRPALLFTCASNAGSPRTDPTPNRGLRVGSRSRPSDFIPTWIAGVNHGARGGPARSRPAAGDREDDRDGDQRADDVDAHVHGRRKASPSPRLEPGPRARATSWGREPGQEARDHDAHGHDQRRLRWQGVPNEYRVLTAAGIGATLCSWNGWSR